MRRRNLLGAGVLLLALAPAGGIATTNGAAGFGGTWRLASATDGKRTRTDLDERLTLRISGDWLEIEYRIADRFGRRELVLRAPLDGTPNEQTVQSRRAVVTALLDGERLVLAIERDAPFGYIRNRRKMQLAADGRRIDSHRENFKENGARHSGWQETWTRVE